MNEFELAQRLISLYINLKEQYPNTTALGSNIERPEFENCDFELLKKILHNKGFEAHFQKIEKCDNLVIYPIP